MADEPLFVAWFARIGPTFEDDPETTYYWSGEGQVTIDVGDGLNTYTGTTVNGTQLVGINAIKENQSGVNRRASITINIPDTADKETFQAALTDPGPIVVKLNWAYSTTKGVSWTRLTRTFLGELSNQRIENNTYSIEIETLTGRDRFGERNAINFEAQRQAYPATTTPDGTVTHPEDDMLFMLPILGSQGVKTRWPRDN